jgi:hypothetical protein
MFPNIQLSITNLPQIGKRNLNDISLDFAGSVFNPGVL